MFITSLRYIEIKTIKTYAWRKEIINSKPITKNTIDIGNTNQNQWIILELAIAQIKLISIFNKICPDIIFANKRIAKLKIREMYETYSIKIRNGIIKIGTPSGKNKTKYFSLWKQIPIILFAIKKDSEKYKVKIK